MYALQVWLSSLMRHVQTLIVFFKYFRSQISGKNINFVRGKSSKKSSMLSQRPFFSMSFCTFLSQKMRKWRQICISKMIDFSSHYCVFFHVSSLQRVDILIFLLFSHCKTILLVIEHRSMNIKMHAMSTLGNHETQKMQ